MKKLSILLTTLLVISILTGCSSSNYQLIQDGENYYIHLSQTDNNTFNSSGLEVAPSITFHSIEEMKSDILTGNFTEDELKEISRFDRNSSGNIVICNISKLYEPILPNDINEYTISWSGNSYRFNPKSASMAIYHRAISKEKYDTEVARISDYIINHADHIVSETTSESSRSVTCIEHIRNDRTIQKTFTTLIADNKTVHIEEFYHLETSESTPEYIHVYGLNNGQYFSVYLARMSTRPSVEWLSQFGIREYVETVTE